MVFCKIPESISDGVTKLLLPNQHLQIGDLNPPGEGDVLNVTSGSSRYFRMESCNFLETEIYNIHISYIYISYIYILLVIQDWLAKCPNTTSSSLSLVFVSPFNVSPTQANHSCVGWARGGL